ncbi:MAG TPA: TIM barrel protein [Clostridia bacterium]|nr:TIM barrel protein [Clostridia bacterium]
MNPFFGPAGSDDRFAAQGYRSVMQAPEYLSRMGLDAYEYQGGRGIRISEENAVQFGKKAREFSIRLSVHAPYYISLSGVDEMKRAGSVDYILQTARAAKWMGAGRIIVHSGSCAKISRLQALEYAKDTLRKALSALDEQGLSDIHICPETMGKINQLGTVEEVMELCSIDERLIPCIDFGHVNARTNGGLKSKRDYLKVLEAVENKLGGERLRHFHSHFSKIEYTEKGGEKRHLTFDDREYGPEFEPLAELCCQKGCSPVFICESSGTQAEDALRMKKIYQDVAEGNEF